MSKNNKNAKRTVAAKAASAQRVKGNGSAAATESKHGKNPANRLYSATRRGGNGGKVRRNEGAPTAAQLAA